MQTALVSDSVTASRGQKVWWWVWVKKTDHMYGSITPLQKCMCTSFFTVNKSTVIVLHYHALSTHVFRISPRRTIRPSGRFRKILIIASPRFLRLGKLKIKQGRAVSNNIKTKQPTQSSSSAKRRRVNAAAAAASVGFSSHPNNHRGLVITMRW